MIKKYTISFDIETDIENTNDLRQDIATALRVGKTVYPYLGFSRPKPEDIRVTVGFCDEPYHPFKFYASSITSDNPLLCSDGSPASPICEADHFHELSDAIADYKAKGFNITVQYIPAGLKEVLVYVYNKMSGSWKNEEFLKNYPHLV